MAKNKIKDFLKSLLTDSKFKYLLVVLVLISYGQILFMQPWQDDNALFFKVAHVNENAGYFGTGAIGDGAYKYSATLFIPIYKFFGFNTILYFGLALLMYALATIVVYKVFSEILGKTQGKISGLIYASGYMVSDGVWRLANSVTTSVSVILALLVFLFYWRYRKKGKFKWYLFALFAFLGGLEFSMSRFHYFFIIIVAFELIFFAFKKAPKSIVWSLVRIIPFYYLFSIRILGTDARIGGIGEYIKAVFSGNLSYTYGFISSIGNLFLPDWITTILFNLQRWLSANVFVDFPLANLLLFIFSAMAVYLLSKKKSYKTAIFLGFSFLIYVWFFVANKIFNTTLINPSEPAIFVSQVGGLVIILSLLFLYRFSNIRKIYLFLFVWFLANISAYSSYNPYLAYSSSDRYLFHSFLPLVGIISIYFTTLPKNKFGKVGKTAIALMVIGNLFFNLKVQTILLSSRSEPTRKFYEDLKLVLPSISKDDILYFDTGNSGVVKFADAISAAMMPNSASFAWRYGIDRYDFQLFTDFDSFKNYLRDHKVDSSKIHTLFYDGSNLVDTHKEFVVTASDNNKTPVSFTSTKNKIELSNLIKYYKLSSIENEIEINSPLYSVTPPDISVVMSCKPIEPDLLSFPLSYLETANKVITDPEELRKFILYSKEKHNFKNNFNVIARSDWRERVSANLVDGDTNTAWQADRLEWQEANEFITIENLNRINVAKIVLVNTYSGQSPTEYQILSSNDLENWKQISYFNSHRRYKDGELIVLNVPSNNSRFLRIIFTKTLNGDSPAFSEIWVSTDELNDVDVIRAEKFLSNPFSWVGSKELYSNLVSQFNNNISVSLLWTNEKGSFWQSSNKATIQQICDGVFRNYDFPLDAGGIKISRLKLLSSEAPVEIEVNKIFVRYSDLIKK